MTLRRLSARCLGLPVLSVCVMTLACDDAPRQDAPRTSIRWSETGSEAATGQVFEDEDFTLEVKEPRICKKDGPMKPGPGTTRVSVPLEVRGKSARQVPVSALLFTLEDADGHEVRPTLAGCAPSILQTTVAEGTKISGEVAFDVPFDFGALELRYEPFLIGRKKVTGRVKVPATPD